MGLKRDELHSSCEDRTKPDGQPVVWCAFVHLKKLSLTQIFKRFVCVVVVFTLVRSTVEPPSHWTEFPSPGRLTGSLYQEVWGLNFLPLWAGWQLSEWNCISCQVTSLYLYICRAGFVLGGWEAEVILCGFRNESNLEKVANFPSFLSSTSK